MKTVAIIAFLACLSLASSWPHEPTEKETMIRLAEDIASRDLDTFKKAVADNDEAKLAQLTRKLVGVVREAQENNKKLAAELAPVSERGEAGGHRKYAAAASPQRAPVPEAAGAVPSGECTRS